MLLDNSPFWLIWSVWSLLWFTVNIKSCGKGNCLLIHFSTGGHPWYAVLHQTWWPATSQCQAVYKGHKHGMEFSYISSSSRVNLFSPCGSIVCRAVLWLCLFRLLRCLQFNSNIVWQSLARVLEQYRYQELCFLDAGVFLPWLHTPTHPPTHPCPYMHAVSVNCAIDSLPPFILWSHGSSCQ